MLDLDICPDTPLSNMEEDEDPEETADRFTQTAAFKSKTDRRLSYSSSYTRPSEAYVRQVQTVHRQHPASRADGHHLQSRPRPGA